MTHRNSPLTLLGVLVPVVLLLYGAKVLSSGVSSVGLLAFARYLQASSQETVTPKLLGAEHLLQQAVLWNPANGSANRGLGFALATQGRENEAVAAWQAVGGMAEELIQRGDQARRAKRYEEALAWYQRAAILEPGFGDAWYDAGLVYERLERWEEALRAYEQAVSVGAFEGVGQSSPYYRLGSIYHRRLTSPQLDKALAAYDSAIAIDDFSSDLEAADSHYERGVIYDWQERDPRDSIREYRQAIVLNPQHRWAHLRLGHALYRVYQNVSLAEQEIEQALALWPDRKSRKWPYRFLGNIYRDAGMLEKAIDVYREALQVDTNDEQVKRILSQLLATHPDKKEQR